MPHTSTTHNAEKSKRYTLVFIAVLFVLFSFASGVLVGKYKVFPFEEIRAVKQAVFGSSDSCEYCGVNSKWTERLEQFRAFPSNAVNVMVGDSITHFGHWEEFFPNHSVLNRGIAYDKTTDVLNRLDTVLSASPKRVFLMMGVNDFNLAQRNVDDVFKSYVRVVNHLSLNGTDIVIQSTLECADCGETTQKIRMLNALLKEYSESNQHAYVNLNALLADDNGLKRVYQRDGIHPNVEGYKIWASILEQYLVGSEFIN